jgi:hypothetical protein
MGSMRSRETDFSSRFSPSNCLNFSALRRKIALCSGSRSFRATSSSGSVSLRTRGSLLGRSRAVTESEAEGFREMESIDLDRVRIRGICVVVLGGV